MSLLTPDEIRAFRSAGRGEYPRWETFVALCDTALALYERNEKLEAVVKALAESDPTPVGVGRCPYCDEDTKWA